MGKQIILTSIEDFINALKNHNIIYNEDASIKYWIYNGFLVSIDTTDLNANPTLNPKIDFNQKFYYYSFN